MADTFFDDPALCGLPLIPSLDYDFTSSCSVSAAPLDNIIEFPVVADAVPLDPLPPPATYRFFGTGAYVGVCDDAALNISSFSSSCPQRIQGYVLDFRIPTPCPSFSASAQQQTGPTVSSVAAAATSVGDCATCLSLFDFSFPCPDIAATACGGGMTVAVTKMSSSSHCIPRFDFHLPAPEFSGEIAVATGEPAIAGDILALHRSNAETCFNDSFNWKLELNLQLPAPTTSDAVASMACGGDCPPIPDSDLTVTALSGCCPGPAKFSTIFDGIARTLNWDGTKWASAIFPYYCQPSSSSINTSLALELTDCNRNGVTLGIPGVGSWRNTKSAFNIKRGGRLANVEYVCDCEAPCHIDLCAGDGASSSAA